jgi:predicted O-methyltransferase YrrM
MIASDYIKTLFEDVEKPEHPRDRRLSVLKEQDVYGYGNENTYFLINEMVRKHAVNGTYLEIGTCQGASLIAAAYMNPTTRCIGMDNFHELGGLKNKPILMSNLANFNLENIEFIEGDYRTVAFSWPMLDVCYYDGQHEIENEWEGLIWCLKYLKPNGILIVDDIAWVYVNEVVKRFAEKFGFRFLFKANGFNDGDNYTSMWHNGFCIMSRGAE